MHRNRFSRLILAVSLPAALLGACSTQPGELVSRWLGGGSDVQGARGTDDTGTVQIILLTALPAARAVLATTADVDHVTLDLQAPRGEMRSHTVPRADLQNGGAGASATFTNLWPGPATVSATVYDAAAVAIGAVSGTSIVHPGKLSILNLSVILVPTRIPAGGIETNVAISDGPEVLVSPDPVQP